MTQKNSDKSHCKWLCKGKSDFMMVSIQFIVNSQEGIKAAAFLTEMIRLVFGFCNISSCDAKVYDEYVYGYIIDTICDICHW